MAFEDIAAIAFIVVCGVGLLALLVYICRLVFRPRQKYRCGGFMTSTSKWKTSQRRYRNY